MKTVDPVCGREVDGATSLIAADADGHCRFFCSQECREAFEKNPAAYAGKRKGLLARYLDRLKKTTGGKPMSCCH
jgi:YHS domain-containing protein